ncbi:DUF2987 domain-containing protein [Alteromonas gilva]|uniref:DUF2987 domain-containing protein n=1 Tax=Alteromonas gilva TaxID=2987522 RepID=A0ABT5L245_9ALTE|nr:DUF2987 domain-containing protein [Alteromonas gilva]MDC8831110.1 DUF2987 domain-containing protein [Alteromonas gilva]
MKRFLLLLPLLVASHSTLAEQIEVEYKRFYSHVSKIGDESTSALQFAFGFMHVRNKALCHINSATIVTQKVDLPLAVSPEQRFLVPKEKALKLADAAIVIDLDEPANLCDMSVQLETTAEYVKKQYSSAELALIKAQYDTFFDDMGGFLSFMMPAVSGLKIQFADKSLNQTLAGAPPIINGTLILDNDWLEQGNALDLPAAPLRITAVAED